MPCLLQFLFLKGSEVQAWMSLAVCPCRDGGLLPEWLCVLVLTPALVKAEGLLQLASCLQLGTSQPC